MFTFIMNRHYGGFILVLGMFLYLINPIISYLVIAAGLIAISNQIWNDPEYGVYLTIFFLPLTKTLDLPIVGTKLGIPDFLFITTLLVYLIKRKVNFEVIKEKFMLPLFAFLFIAVLSGAKAISFVDWFIEILTYIYLTIFFVFMISVLNKKNISKAIDTLILSLTFVIIFGFIGYLLILFDVQNNPFGYYYRVLSVFKMVNQLSMTLLLGFFLMLNKSEINKKLIPICVLGAFVFLASGTRVVPIVLIPFLIIYITYKSYNKKIPWSGILVLATVLLLVFGPANMIKPEGVQRSVELVKNNMLIGEKETVAPPNNIVEKNSTIVVEEENFILEFVKKSDRTRYLQLVAFNGMIKENFILGVGAGNFIHQMPNYVESTQYWEMHNTFLGILAEEGTLGLIAFIGFLISIMFLSIKKYSKNNKDELVMLSLGILAMLSYCMVHFGLRNRHFWLVLALLIVVIEK